MCYSSWLVFSDRIKVLDHTPNEHILLLWTNRKLLDYVKIFVTFVDLVKLSHLFL